MNKYMYLVEGETEEKFINTLKLEGLIVSGKVKVLNPLVKSTMAIERQVKANTVVIFIFDIDVLKKGIVNINKNLEPNIKKLSKNKNIKLIWIIQQVDNLEDELVKSTNIKEIKELLNSKSNKNVKNDITKCTNLYVKLTEKEFNIEKLWINIGISSLNQDSGKIKL